jgi:hypothetical protein
MTSEPRLRLLNFYISAVAMYNSQVFIRKHTCLDTHQQVPRGSAVVKRNKGIKLRKFVRFLKTSRRLS